VHGDCRPNHAYTVVQGKYTCTRAWVLFIAASMNAWVWSAVFHARDLSWTERMDYTAAFSVVICGCAAAVHRMIPTHGYTALCSAAVAHPSSMAPSHCVTISLKLAMKCRLALRVIPATNTQADLTPRHNGSVA
jgi:hypothetical protein